MNNRVSITEKKITNIFKELSDNHNIPFEEFKIYLQKIFGKKKRKKTQLQDFERCMARKQDGFQCSRRRKKNNEYCGKHIKNRPYGRIDNENDKESIPVKNIVIEDKEYLIDNNKIVFNLNGDMIVGKLMDDGKIFYI